MSSCLQTNKRGEILSRGNEVMINHVSFYCAHQSYSCMNLYNLSIQGHIHKAQDRWWQLLVTTGPALVFCPGWDNSHEQAQATVAGSGMSCIDSGPNAVTGSSTIILPGTTRVPLLTQLSTPTHVHTHAQIQALHINRPTQHNQAVMVSHVLPGYCSWTCLYIALKGFCVCTPDFTAEERGSERGKGGMRVNMDWMYSWATI